MTVEDPPPGPTTCGTERYYLLKCMQKIHPCSEEFDKLHECMELHKKEQKAFNIFGLSWDLWNEDNDGDDDDDFPFFTSTGNTKENGAKRASRIPPILLPITESGDKSNTTTIRKDTDNSRPSEPLGTTLFRKPENDDPVEIPHIKRVHDSLWSRHKLNIDHEVRRDDNGSEPEHSTIDNSNNNVNRTTNRQPTIPRGWTRFLTIPWNSNKTDSTTTKDSDPLEWSPTPIDSKEQERSCSGGSCQWKYRRNELSRNRLPFSRWHREDEPEETAADRNMARPFFSLPVVADDDLEQEDNHRNKDRLPLYRSRWIADTTADTNQQQQQVNKATTAWVDQLLGTCNAMSQGTNEQDRLGRFANAYDKVKANDPIRKQKRGSNDVNAVGMLQAFQFCVAMENLGKSLGNVPGATTTTTTESSKNNK